LKTFLTQIRPALPLPADPPAICFWKWIWWRTVKNKKSQFGKRFCQKRIVFPTWGRLTHLMYPCGPTRIVPASDPVFPGSVASRDAKRDRSGSQRATTGTRRSTIGTGDSVRDARQSRSPQLLAYTWVRKSSYSNHRWCRHAKHGWSTCTLRSMNLLRECWE
jgi:hypothetical protein